MRAARFPRDAVGLQKINFQEDMEDDVKRRLKIELKQTMDTYHAACKEALAALNFHKIKFQDDIEDDYIRLKIELKQTMDMYHAACKEALSAKQKVMELEKWKIKEEKRLKEKQMGEDREKAKIKAEILRLLQQL